MSDSSNVRKVQRIYECFGRGDVPAILEMLTEDVQWREYEHPQVPYSGKRQGKAAVAEFFAAITAIQVTRFDPQEFIDVGDRVIVVGGWGGTVKATGKAFDNDWVMFWRFRDGLVSSFHAYEDMTPVAAAFRRD